MTQLALHGVVDVQGERDEKQSEKRHSDIGKARRARHVRANQTVRTALFHFRFGPDSRAYLLAKIKG